MNRRRFVKSAGLGTAGLLIRSAASSSAALPGRPDPPASVWTSPAKVFVRWTEPGLPLATALGMQDLAIPWGADRALMESARKQGYRIYVAATLEQASAAADAAHAKEISGVILESGDASQKSVEETANRLRRAHPGLSVLVPGAGGKQPAMKGSTISKQGGILEVSSPTAQPWLDSNFAKVAYDRAFRPAQAPLIDFTWELSDSLQQQQGPGANDYSLAVAEAGALHCDLLLNLHPNLQKGLAHAGTDEWDTWKQVVQYMQFYFHSGDAPVAMQANVGLVTDSYDASYETANLLARNNIPFRMLRDLAAHDFDGLDLIVWFTQPSEAEVKQVAEFTTAGGVAILVGLHGHFPWHLAGASPATGPAATSTMGKGKVIELAESAADPGAFAQDVRRLLGKEKSLISLWNATTVLATVCKTPAGSESALELVNYSAEPLPVQARIKGSYAAAQYESPEHDHDETLRTTVRDGFTEFVVSALHIGGRVHLA